jgi:Protein of unknown function DUF262
MIPEAARRNRMGLEQATVKEIVDKAVTHKWGVPEFQRGFVWSPQKVRDLVDSLWRGYPVGSFLVWYAGEYAQPRTMEDHQIPDAWSSMGSNEQPPSRSSSDGSPTGGRGTGTSPWAGTMCGSTS